MTETREKIIALLEPYMDKTLDFGCYIKFPDGIVQVSIVEELGVKYFGNDGEVYGVEHRHFGILGNYDITALLKYFETKITYSYRKQSNGIDVLVLYYSVTDYENNKNYIEIPNKPLSLYTEQEDLDLLNILVNLK